MIVRDVVTAHWDVIKWFWIKPAICALLGHNWGYWEAFSDGTEIRVCDRCTAHQERPVAW